MPWEMTPVPIIDPDHGMEMELLFKSRDLMLDKDF